MERRIENQDESIVIKAEIKRLSERLNKKELCVIYGISYQFYLNTVQGKNKPSQKMVKRLREYIETDTAEVYRMVFKSRVEEEVDYEKLFGLKDEEVRAIQDDMVERNILQEL